MKNKAEHIYIHFPFCVSKCPYCDFYSETGYGNDSFKLYFEYLTKEIEMYSDLFSAKVKSIYFGGGTPSLADPKDLSKILDQFNYDNETEITIELNPGSVSKMKFQELQDSGFNRLSIGSQSFINRDLKTLGRIHDTGSIYNAFYNAREAGFSNLNLDLIIGIPGQTPAAVLFNASEIKRLKPEHISAYILTYYEATPFLANLKDNKLIKIHDDVEVELFDLTAEILSDGNYDRYEISNFSLPGKRSVHNMNTWDFGDYLGFGASAHSFFLNRRWANPSSLDDYYRNIGNKKYLFKSLNAVDITTLKNESLMLGLRKLEGIGIDGYNNLFGSCLLSDYGLKLRTLLNKGFIEIKNDSLMICENKINIFNSIVSDLML